MPNHRIPRRPTKHLAPGLIAIALVFVLGVAILSALLYHNAVMEERRERTMAQADSLIERADSLFAAIPDLRSSELRQMRTYLNKQHVDRAQTLGVETPPSREAALTLSQQDKLEPLDADRYYHVRPMDYSVPFVTDDMAHLLTLIGHRMQERLAEYGLPPYRFVITSATRSREDQRALRRVNVNAVSESSHQYGTTVDLHYRAFRYSAAYDSLPTPEDIIPELLRDRMSTAYNNFGQVYHEKLKALLGRVLLELQEEGKVLIIHERRQPVYHITVGERIEPPMIAEQTPPSATGAPADRSGSPPAPARSEDGPPRADAGGTASTPSRSR